MTPEYAMRGYLTDKADVYSFGIVALEIVSGKSNTNYRPKKEFVYLLDWVMALHCFLEMPFAREKVEVVTQENKDVKKYCFLKQ